MYHEFEPEPRREVPVVVSTERDVAITEMVNQRTYVRSWLLKTAVLAVIQRPVRVESRQSSKSQA